LQTPAPAGLCLVFDPRAYLFKAPFFGRLGSILLRPRLFGIAAAGAVCRSCRLRGVRHAAAGVLFRFRKAFGRRLFLRGLVLGNAPQGFFDKPGRIPQAEKRGFAPDFFCPPASAKKGILFARPDKRFLFFFQRA
jgi:hypothetical protein